MDKKIIFNLLGNVLTAFSLILIPMIIYCVAFDFEPEAAIFFLAFGMWTLVGGIFFLRLGRGHSRRLTLSASATTMLLIYPLVAAIAMIPIFLFGGLSISTTLLETISDLTSAGVSLLPKNAPYFLRLWQSLLMWFGSLIFLVMLATTMPKVSGCFGLDLSLHGGQSFSPAFGQMNLITRRIIKIYVLLTAISFISFKAAGLNFWDAFLMAMRCTSTGGGDFFPGRGNIFVEYAAAFSMLLACGNLLFYHRLIVTIPPPETVQEGNIFQRAGRYVKRLKRNIFYNVGHFFRNSEVKASLLIIFLCVGLVMFTTYRRGIILDGNDAFRYSIFHAISFLSTTGINLANVESFHDFDRFLIFFTAIIGGCMGSVTGGLKMMRAVVLAKVTATELKHTMHPHMISRIRVNGIVVPPEIVGRILAFFFLSSVTLFICAMALSFCGIKFSEAVAMSAACLTNVGVFPGICDAENFLQLPLFGKIFCAGILILGRLEIFVFLIAIAGIKFRHRNIKW